MEKNNTGQRKEETKLNSRLERAAWHCTACRFHQQMQNSGKLQAVQCARAALEVWRSLHAQNWWETVLGGCSHPWSRGWTGRVGRGWRSMRWEAAQSKPNLANDNSEDGEKWRKQSTVQSNNTWRKWSNKLALWEKQSVWNIFEIIPISPVLSRLKLTQSWSNINPLGSRV